MNLPLLGATCVRPLDVWCALVADASRCGGHRLRWVWWSLAYVLDVPFDAGPAQIRAALCREQRRHDDLAAEYLTVYAGFAAKAAARRAA